MTSTKYISMTATPSAMIICVKISVCDSVSPPCVIV